MVFAIFRPRAFLLSPHFVEGNKGGATPLFSLGGIPLSTLSFPLSPNFFPNACFPVRQSSPEALTNALFCPKLFTMIN